MFHFFKKIEITLSNLGRCHKRGTLAASPHLKQSYYFETKNGSSRPSGQDRPHVSQLKKNTVFTTESQRVRVLSKTFLEKRYKINSSLIIQKTLSLCGEKWIFPVVFRKKNHREVIKKPRAAREIPKRVDAVM